MTYEGTSIYLLHYPKSEEIFVSYGIIKKVEKEIIYNFNHLCSTERGSSGGPILNLSNNKIIGIHKAAKKNDNYNIGLFLKYPLSEFINKIKKEEIIKKSYNDNII